MTYEESFLSTCDAEGMAPTMDEEHSPISRVHSSTKRSMARLLITSVHRVHSPAMSGLFSCLVTKLSGNP